MRMVAEPLLTCLELYERAVRECKKKWKYREGAKSSRRLTVLLKSTDMNTKEGAGKLRRLGII